MLTDTQRQLTLNVCSNFSPIAIVLRPSRMQTNAPRIISAICYLAYAASTRSNSNRARIRFVLSGAHIALSAPRL